VASTRPGEAEGTDLPNVRGRFFWRIIRLAAGWTLLLFGVIGLFLPVLQGLLFIASGLAVLSTESQWARRLLDKLKSWRRGRKTGDLQAPNDGDGTSRPPTG
jgi:Putative transmembrane protein (PGPGW)